MTTRHSESWFVFRAPLQQAFFIRVEVDSPGGRAYREGLARVAEIRRNLHVDDLGLLRHHHGVARRPCLTDLLYRQQTQGLPIGVIAVVGRPGTRRPVTAVPLPEHSRREGTKAGASSSLSPPKGGTRRPGHTCRSSPTRSAAPCRAASSTSHHSFLPSFKGARLRAGYDAASSSSARPPTT